MTDKMHQPPPRGLSILTRILELACLVVVIAWVRTLGGVSLRPVWTNSTTNDTGKLFNWHPIVQTTAFAVLMAEALQAWRSPIIPLPERKQRKILHAVLQTMALLAMWTGVVIAYLSHSLKRPAQIPNLYSTHSWMGALTLSLATAQFVAGLTFVVTGISLAQRQRMAPYHVWLGRATFVIGLATMSVGIQEKTTFSQIFGKLALRSAGMQLPAVLNLLLIALGAAVLYAHTAPSHVSKEPSGFSLLENDQLEESP